MLDTVPAFGIGEYTLMTVLAVVLVVLLELLWLRTGIFRTARYWLTMVIVFAFQVPVDGWLTKLSDPIVIYNERQMTGVRMPWDIPVEDFGFGFAMVTLAILLWRRRLDGPHRVAATTDHATEDATPTEHPIPTEHHEMPDQHEARTAP